MNDNNENNTYRATRNLNTALESPEYNVNDTLDVNIENVNNNNYARDNKVDFASDNSFIDNSNVDDNSKISSFSNSVEEKLEKNADDFSDDKRLESNTFISSDISKGISHDESVNDINAIDNENSVTLMTDNDESSSNYIPTSSERKKKVPFTMPTELKILVVIVLILLVFVFFMPKVYRIIKNIELFFFNR